MDELWHQIYGHQILRGEEVLGVVDEVVQRAVDEESVGHATGLSTLTAIGTASSPRLGAEALARVGHAQRPVDEDLNAGTGLSDHRGDLREGELSSQDDPVHSEGLGDEGHSSPVSEAHLR